jgi:hypothetical protein
MQQNQAQQQQQAQQYVDSVMKAFQEKPSSLSAQERQLAEKCIRGDQRARILSRQAAELRDRISTTQEQLRQTELTIEREQGTVNGMIELLVESKFGGNGAVPGQPGGNGAEDKPANRKQRRAKAAAEKKTKASSPPPEATA